MKKHCEICGKMVAEIEPGSRIRKGTIWICRECAEEYGFGESHNDAPQRNAGQDNIVNELNKIFGGFKV
jgi:ribosome-binding protein aMBF1 (putative translation factor)